MFDDTWKTHAQTITIKQFNLQAIGSSLNKAYECIKQPCTTTKQLHHHGLNVEVSSTESTILKTLAQIQNSVTSLESKYENIEAKITTNTAPKTYTESIKATPKIDPHEHRRTQLETLRMERLKHTITLSIKDAPTIDQTRILNMSSQEIIMCCYEALHPEMNLNTVTNPTIIQGVSKLSGALRIQLTSQEDIESIYSDSSAIDWNKAFKIKSGIMLNQLVYGIVVHGVLVSDINPNQMTDSTYLYTFERENAIAHGSITKISTLRRRNAPSQYSHNSDLIKQPRHHSIVIYLTNSEVAN